MELELELEQDRYFDYSATVALQQERTDDAESERGSSTQLSSLTLFWDGDCEFCSTRAPTDNQIAIFDCRSIPLCFLFCSLGTNTNASPPNKTKTRG